jgi:hypothetical protein
MFRNLCLKISSRLSHRAVERGTPFNFCVRKLNLHFAREHGQAAGGQQHVGALRNHVIL